jgi:hypothetical protein
MATCVCGAAVVRVLLVLYLAPSPSPSMPFMTWLHWLALVV